MTLRFKKTLALLGLLLGIFSFFRLLLFLLYNPQFQGTPPLSLLFAFLNGVRYDLAMIAIFYALPVAGMNLPYVSHPRAFASFSFLAYLLTLGIAFFLACDLVYFGYVFRHLEDEPFLVSNDLDFLLSLTLTTYGKEFLLFVIGSVLLGALWYFFFTLKTPPRENPKRKGIELLSLALLFGIMARGTFTRKPLSVVDAFASGEVALANLTLNGLFTAVHSGLHSRKEAPRTFFPEGEAVKLLELKGSLRDPRYPLYRSYGGEPRLAGRPNLIFILVESLSPEYVDAFGREGLGVTPNLDALALGGRRYTHFYAMGYRSLQAIQTILTGVPSLPSLPELNFGLELNRLTPLGRLAQEYGYHTIFLQSSRRRSYRLDSVAKATGFQEYYGMEDYPQVLTYPGAPPKFGWDYEPFHFLFQRLERIKEPFFVFFFTGTTHGPYPLLPPRYMRYPHEPTGVNGYLNALYYFDASLGEFLEKARTTPWFSRTLWVITGDHNPQLPRRFPQANPALSFHIPLILAGAGIEPGEDPTPGSHQDLLPTLVDLLWNPSYFSAAGESLLQGGRGFAFVHPGGFLALFTPHAYLAHNLERPLLFVADPPDPLQEEILSRKLLAEYQLVTTLVRGNRWSP